MFFSHSHHRPVRRRRRGSLMPLLMLGGAAYALMRLSRSDTASQRPGHAGASDDGARGGASDEGSAANQALQDSAHKALAMKQAADARQERPFENRTAHEGMRNLPNRDIAPSGALEAEGFKPAFERGGKAR